MRNISREGKRRISQYKLNRLLLRMRCGLASPSDVLSLPYCYFRAISGGIEMPLYESKVHFLDAVTISTVVFCVVSGLRAALLQVAQGGYQ
ncbi:MAG: hypothetical protein JKX97_08680 [Candidatus Lindowbacteria bacterium]|nr:hypothetical protein [Candidatus Lindowbacteria bacterium]